MKEVGYLTQEGGGCGRLPLDNRSTLLAIEWAGNKLAIEWEGGIWSTPSPMVNREESGSGDIPSGVVKEPSSEGPTGILKDGDMIQAECGQANVGLVSLNSSENVNVPTSMIQAKCVSDNCEVNVSIQSKATKVTKKENEVRNVNKPKKVWMKLSNGLYGYRVRKTAVKRLAGDKLSESEHGLSSVGIQKWVPGFSEKSTQNIQQLMGNSSKMTSTKRKFEGGGGLERG